MNSQIVIIAAMILGLFASALRLSNDLNYE
jgi:hypothetical protein